MVKSFFISQDRISLNPAQGVISLPDGYPQPLSDEGAAFIIYDG